MPFTCPLGGFRAAATCYKHRHASPVFVRLVCNSLPRTFFLSPPAATPVYYHPSLFLYPICRHCGIISLVSCLLHLCERDPLLTESRTGHDPSHFTPCTTVNQLQASFAMARPSSTLRLLMPTVRSPIPYASPPSPSAPPTRSPRVRQTTGRLSGVRPRSGSAATSVDKSGLASSPTIWNSEQGELTDGERWIGRKFRFEIVVERMELVGYQVYAVEKW